MLLKIEDREFLHGIFKKLYWYVFLFFEDFERKVIAEIKNHLYIPAKYCESVFSWKLMNEFEENQQYQEYFI